MSQQAHGSAEEQPGDRLVGSDRVLAVLLDLASRPAGGSLDELAERVSSPKATVHRALATLKRAGLARQEGRGHYVLGDEFLRLAFNHHQSRPESVRVGPVLERLAERFGETAHYAVLDGTDVVYRAKVEPTVGSVRLTSTIGGRNPVHRTAVGKLLLSRKVSSEEALREQVGPGPFLSGTPRSITSVGALWAELQLTRNRGYGVDDQENELGVNCFAVPLAFAVPGAPAGAISISALAYRTPIVELVDAHEEIMSIVTSFVGPQVK